MRKSRLGVGLALLLISVVTPLQAQKEQRVGNFTVAHITDPMNDRDRSFAMVMGNDNKLGIGLKCFDDGLNFILLHKYMGGDDADQIRVQLRFDNNEALDPIYFDVASGNHHSFSPLMSVPILTAGLARSSTVTIRAVDPLDGETVTDYFNLTGAKEAIFNLPCVNRK